MKYARNFAAAAALTTGILAGCGSHNTERDWKDDLTQEDLTNAQESLTLAVAAYESHKAGLEPDCVEAVEPYLFGGAYESAPTNLSSLAVQAACQESELALPQSRALHGEVMRMLNLLQVVQANVTGSDD